MIESLIANLFGPFILFGVIIVAFGIMSGARVEGLFQAYLRFCFHLFSALAIPAFRGLSYLAVWFGDRLHYVLDDHNESVQVADFTVEGVRQKQAFSTPKPTVTPAPNAEAPLESEDAVDVEIVS